MGIRGEAGRLVDVIEGRARWPGSDVRRGCEGVLRTIAREDVAPKHS
jgi:hypothetical protein